MPGRDRFRPAVKSSPLGGWHVTLLRAADGTHGARMVWDDHPDPDVGLEVLVAGSAMPEVVKTKTTARSQQDAYGSDSRDKRRAAEVGARPTPHASTTYDHVPAGATVYGALAEARRQVRRSVLADRRSGPSSSATRKTAATGFAAVVADAAARVRGSTLVVPTTAQKSHEEGATLAEIVERLQRKLG